MTRRVVRRHCLPLFTLMLAVVLAAAGCSGDSGETSSTTPAKVLATAKQKLDATDGVSLRLSTPNLPKGVDGVLQATGVGNHQPAFQGTLKVLVNNITVDVPVVSVDGKVYARLPFTKSFNEVDPTDYGAPDPADLMDPASGLSSWLTATSDVQRGNRSRQGDQVLTSYTGTLPGATVAKTIPSARASADFSATYRVDDSGRLVTAEVRGPFYRSGEVDYTIELSNYGTRKDITKP